MQLCADTLKGGGDKHELYFRLISVSVNVSCQKSQESLLYSSCSYQLESRVAVRHERLKWMQKEKSRLQLGYSLFVWSINMV